MSDLERAGAQHAAIAEALARAFEAPSPELRLLLWQLSAHLASEVQRAIVRHQVRGDE